MRRRRDEELYGAFDEQEDELSLEAILAEYGKGGRQPVPTEEAATPETPAEEKAPVPVSEAVPPSETEAPSEPDCPGEKRAGIRVPRAGSGGVEGYHVPDGGRGAGGRG